MSFLFLFKKSQMFDIIKHFFVMKIVFKLDKGVLQLSDYISSDIKEGKFIEVDVGRIDLRI